jgi:hypothetical protein
MEKVKAIINVFVIGILAGYFAVFTLMCWLLTSIDFDPNNEENDQNF